jgi:enoyl-[acyl-carrier protein] reductase I
MSKLEGKKILILGVSNDKSIGWGIAKALHEQGAELAFTFVNESLEKRVRPLAESISCPHVVKCDVQSDDDIKALFAYLESHWGSLDGLVHSVAYAEREDLQSRFCHTSRKGFHTALDVSAYSLIALAGGLLPLFTQGSSLLTLTYLGSEKVVTNYNVMGVAKAALEASVRYLAADLGEQGIRVNAISAGPIKTLAASGIPRFREMLSEFAQRAPLKRPVTTEDVANVAVHLLSPDSAAVTGEVTFVDCGFNIMGL